MNIQKVFGWRSMVGQWSTTIRMTVVTRPILVAATALSPSPFLGAIRTKMSKPERLEANLTHLRNATQVGRQLNYARQIKYKTGLKLEDYHKILEVISKQRYFEEVVQIVRLMRYRCVDPDLQSFHYALKAYNARCHIKQAERVLRDLKAKVTPTTETYNIMIEITGRSGNINESKTYLDKMIESGEANDDSYLAFVKSAISYSKPLYANPDSKFVKSNEIYDLVQSVKFPSISKSDVMKNCYSHLLQFTVFAKRWEDAVELIILMRDNAVEVPSELYEEIIDGLKSVGKLLDYWKPDPKYVDMEHLQQHLNSVTVRPQLQI